MPYIMKEYKREEDTYDELTERFELLKKNNKGLIKEYFQLEEENKKNINIIEELWGKNIDELHEELKKSNEDRNIYYEKYNEYINENIYLKKVNEKYKIEILKLNQELIKVKSLHKNLEGYVKAEMDLIDLKSQLKKLQDS
jgi:hypothetical protein